MLPDLQADRARAAELDAQIFDLTAQRALVQKRLDAYRYPVLTLANEITSDIFVHFLPAYPACPPLAGLLSPTTLTQVCRQWREVALATPLLWRAVQSSFASNIEPSKQALEISRWLSISNAPHVSLEMIDKATYSDYEIIECLRSWESQIVAALTPHRARWQYMKLRFTHSNSQHLHEFESPMPMLHHLDLAFGRSTSPLGRILLGEAPLLRSVILDRVAKDTLILPWAQLTSLGLRAVEPRECGAVLEQTPNLVHCDIVLALIEGDTDTCPHLTLLRLESLVLDEYYRRSTMADQLENLVCPALRTLEIAEGCLGIRPCYSLISFVSRSRCNLETIVIRGTRYVSQDAYTSTLPNIRFCFNGEYDGYGEDVASDGDLSKDEEE
ncbi:hypothetical protein C8R46DRAFT_1087445 [Mycena filopes]|nr:hypothetical protein C8R46DRAFT_1087445 [Mycena filopes]